MQNLQPASLPSSGPVSDSPASDNSGGMVTGRLRSLARREWFSYLGAVLLSLVIVVMVMQLYRADLRLPLAYQGDVMFYHMIVRGMTQNGWFGQTPLAGAPDVLDLRDVPTSDHNLFLLMLRVIGLLTSNYSLIINIFFLLSFPLTVVSALYVLRRFGISRAVAVPCSLLYAFLPYHFVRGEHHLFLSSYYLIPPMMMVVLWICNGTLSLFTGSRGKQRFHLRQPRLWGALLICVLVASTGAYYAFFSCFFLLMGAILAVIQQKNPRPLVLAMLLIGAIVAVNTLNLLPDLIQLNRHGDTAVVKRTIAEAEAYGLRLTQMLLPMSGHRIYRVKEFKDRYNTRPFINENDDATLGLMGSCGFLLLLGLVFYRTLNGRELFRSGIASLLNQLSLLSLAGVLLGTIGGFSALVALILTPKIRGYNRISIFLSFMAIFAVALFLQFLSERFVHTGRQRVVFYGFLALSLCGGIFDQTSKRFLPNYELIASEFRNDAAFSQAIEARMPAGSAIFQLPLMMFPENPRLHKMLDYDPARGFLHANNLRWSYGAIRGRENYAWQKIVTEKPARELVEQISFAGFSGLWLDRFGYTDNGAAMEKDMNEMLGAPPLVSHNQRFLFYDLRDFTGRLTRPLAAADLDARRDEALHPLLTLWKDGFSFEEFSGGNAWRWAAEESRMDIVNDSKQTRQVTLETVLSAGRDAVVKIESPFFSEEVNINQAGVSFSRALTIPPGRHVFRFSCYAPRVIAPMDPRILVLRVQNFRLNAALAAMPARAGARN
ncbi:MAG: hypothetical protein ACKV2V_19545 [Blastocatellia bacterium]